MKSKTAEQTLQTLTARRANVEGKITAVQDRARGEIDADAQLAARHELGSLREELEAVEAAITVAEAQRVQAEVEEKAAREARWRDKLHPQGVREIDAALANVLDSLRVLRKSWDSYVQVREKWIAQWISEGRPEPGIPHPAAANSLGAYLSVVQSRQGGSPSAQRADELARRVLLGPVEVEKR